jgi:hypothetical protein
MSLKRNTEQYYSSSLTPVDLMTYVEPAADDLGTSGNWYRGTEALCIEHDLT